MVGEVAHKWHEMDEEEKSYSVRRMEAYAAMVNLVDRNSARVIDYLGSTSGLDNTFVLFMSDNAAEGKLLEALPL